MNMAWNPDAFDASNLEQYAQGFCAQQFGDKEAKEVARLLMSYGRYASRVQAELLDDKTYNLQTGEFKGVRDEFLALEARALRQYLTLDETAKDAYQELVLFPIQGMANLYDMYYSLAMNKQLYREGRIEANTWADRVEECYKRDSLLCDNYNHHIANGKWNHMMDQVHIGYQNWHAPQHQVMPMVYRIQQSTPFAVTQPSTGYVFEQDGGMVVMEAEHLFSLTPAESEKSQWRLIPGLGRTKSGIALFPYTQPTAGAYLTYKMRFKADMDSVDVHLVTDAVMPFVLGGHYVAVSLDGGKEEIVGLNQNLNWEHKYDLMYPTAASRIIEKEVRMAVENTGKAEHTLRLRPMQPGIVFEKILINLGGYKPTHLGMLESPYVK